MSTRRRRSYIEEHAEELAQGKPIESTVQAEELDELDKASVQEKILHPPTIDVTKLDGTVIKCKTQFGPSDIVKRKVMDALSALTEVLIYQTVRMGCDPDVDAQWFDRNLGYLTLATKRMNVQLLTVDAIATLSGERAAIDDFAPDALAAATLALFKLYLERMTEVTRHSKNSATAKT